ncbi:unnamed protein product [Urochloa humidicola]
MKRTKGRVQIATSTRRNEASANEPPATSHELRAPIGLPAAPSRDSGSLAARPPVIVIPRPVPLAPGLSVGPALPVIDWVGRDEGNVSLFLYYKGIFLFSLIYLF